MTRLLQYMLALLELFKDKIMCSLKFHFYLNLLVDITTISATSNITISILLHHFLFGNGPMFGRTSKNWGKFLREFARNL